MSHFFSNLVQAGSATVNALIKGSSKTFLEMQEAQKTRSQTFNGMMNTLSFKTHQIEARKQYWCTQTFFLAQLIKTNNKKITEIIGSPIDIDNKTGLLDAMNKLINSLSSQNNVQKFLDILKEDCTKIQMTALKSVTTSFPQLGIQFYNGDVIELIKDLSSKGTLVIANNAPNSHRDGAAKYSAGSVEELFSRYTDSALKMALHFEDVHQRNFEKGYFSFTDQPKSIDVLDYQKRYLQMVLTICSKLLQKNETYLESHEFLNDLFMSFPNQDAYQLPIYFDMQNNAYEVPVDGGFTSAHWFANTKQLNSVAGIFQKLKTSDTNHPLYLVSYAAPDLRKLETSPLDARSTSNSWLQQPSQEGNLGCMLTAGIALQCQKAIEQAQMFKAHGINQSVAVVFIMPGCGAFNNPEQSTAAHFISTIKYFYPQLAEHNISCHIAEYNPKLYHLLMQSNALYGPELGHLNELINHLTIPSLRLKAIAVREKIVSLYKEGESSELLTNQLKLTIKLLMTQPGEERNRITDEYKQNAMSLETHANGLWNALAIAMIALGSLITSLGVILGATGFGLLPGAGVAVGGATLLGAGIGLFARNKYNTLTEKTTDFIDGIENTPSVYSGCFDFVL